MFVVRAGGTPDTSILVLAQAAWREANRVRVSRSAQ
jgi:hypothetical protein